MPDLTKLRELQEQASPGPWRVVRGYPNNDVVEYCVLTDGDKNVSLKASELYESDAKLAALAPHLLPIAEALEAAQAQIHGEFCRVSTIAPGHSKHCSNATAKLKALTEALDGVS